MPPWPHEEHLDSDRSDGPDGSSGPTGPDAGSPRDRNPFRARHGLGDRFVVMYSGNHSPSNPLTTLLRAAVRLKDDPGLRFLFVGGGTGKKEVEAVIRDHGLTNALSLPYQPLSELGHSLSAADVHVVSLGPEMVGIIHPCKVYGAMAVARPVLYFGPRPSHITDLLDAHGFGLHVAHGDVDGAVRAIQTLRRATPEQRAAMGAAGRAALRRSLSQEALVGRFCDRLEQALFGEPTTRAAGGVPGIDLRPPHFATSPRSTNVPPR